MLNERFEAVYFGISYLLFCILHLFMSPYIYSSTYNSNIY